MSTLLHLDASARSNRSLSRALSAAFVDGWRKAFPTDTIIRRDLAMDPPPHVTETWIAGAFGDPEQRTPEEIAELRVSDTLIEEVLGADILVIGAAMYNYGMPSALKAWLDQVVRVGRTFSFDLARGAQPIEPIQTGKTLVALVSSGEGGFQPGGHHAHMNHLDPALITASRLLGVSTSHVVRIEYQEFGDDRHARSIEAAHAELPNLIATIREERKL
ncbi:MAG: NAD(P)H-dependent oxidoreductase [Erythrobacter sp.]